MPSQWVSSSTSLPLDDAPIMFKLDDREAALRGSYAKQVFHSRWAAYDIGRVLAWSVEDANPLPALVDVPKKAPADALFPPPLLKRLVALFAQHDVAAGHVLRTTSMNRSNQMSS